MLAPALNTIFNTVQSQYRPGRKVDLARFWSLFAYSRQILGTSLMGFFNTRTDDFLIGCVIGATALGIYTVAYRLLLVMNDVLTTTARSVAFPVFSRVQHDIPRLARAYASAMRMSAVIAFPIFALHAGRGAGDHPDAVRAAVERRASPSCRSSACSGCSSR